jgi:hypothetical protein
MFTGYLVGFAAFRALFDHSPAMVLSKLCFPLFFYKLKVLLTNQPERKPTGQLPNPNKLPRKTPQNKIIPNILN